MAVARLIVLVAVVAPGVCVPLAAAGRLDLAGLVTGALAGLLLRDHPAKAAVATLYGSVSAVLSSRLLLGGIVGEPHTENAFAGWPGWVAGAVLAYLIASGGMPRAPARTTDAKGPAVAFVVAAGVACGHLVAAKALGLSYWIDYARSADGLLWFHDLIGAIFMPAASVVVTCLLVTARFGGFLAPPLAAWAGCAVVAAPVQYAQALGAPSKPASIALLASLAGGGIGAAAAAVRHFGVRVALVAFILLFTVVRLLRQHVFVYDLFSPWALVVAAVVIAAIAAATAWRDSSLGSGVLAGVAGPLLIWSIYVMVGSRNYDHAVQSAPYYFVLVVTLVAPIIALVAAGLARLVHRHMVSPTVTAGVTR